MDRIAVITSAGILMAGGAGGVPNEEWRKNLLVKNGIA